MANIWATPQLLVSIRSVKEADQLRGTSLSIVDVKEPRRGSLGAATPKVLQQIRDRLGGQVTLSAALGELRDARLTGQLTPPLVEALQGYQFAKIGLAGCGELHDWRERWREWLGPLPVQIIPVAVAYADRTKARSPQIGEVLEYGSQLGCGALLIDTFDKSSGDVFDYLADAELSAWIEQAHRKEMLIAIAGSLTLATLPRCLALGPDIVAVRGAVCASSREKGLSRRRLKEVVAAVGPVACPTSL